MDTTSGVYCYYFHLFYLTQLLLIHINKLEYLIRVFQYFSVLQYPQDMIKKIFPQFAHCPKIVKPTFIHFYKCYFIIINTILYLFIFFHLFLFLKHFTFLSPYLVFYKYVSYSLMKDLG